LTPIINRTKSTLAMLAVLCGLSLATPALLASCATSSTQTNPAAAINQAIADAQIVVSGVQNSYNALHGLYPQAITAQTDAQVQALFAAAPGILAGLSTGADSVTNASGLRGVESLINQILNITAVALAQVPGIPPQMLLGLQAATVLLPLIEATANQLVPITPTVGAPPPRFTSAMSPAQARQVLRK
jgi:hypothetical protein